MTLTPESDIMGIIQIGFHTLAGDVPALEPGDEVQVQGVWAEDGPCRMGLTIQVSQAEVF